MPTKWMATYFIFLRLSTKALAINKNKKRLTN